MRAFVGWLDITIGILALMGLTVIDVPFWTGVLLSFACGACIGKGILMLTEGIHA